MLDQEIYIYGSAADKSAAVLWRVLFSFRPSSSHHYVPGAGHQEDGQEERHRPQPAFRWDPGLHVRHLLW